VFAEYWGLPNNLEELPEIVRVQHACPRIFRTDFVEADPNVGILLEEPNQKLHVDDRIFPKATVETNDDVNGTDSVLLLVIGGIVGEETLQELLKKVDVNAHSTALEE
jgi:hypothetical protein